MKIDKEYKEAYNKHSSYSTSNDGKKRRYYFDIENLEGDYKEFLNILPKNSSIKFDFVASCLHKNQPALRVFSENFVGRFLIGENIPLSDFQNKLIKDGFILAEKNKKSGPLRLNADFSEPFSAKWFRLKLPFWEFKMWFKHDFIRGRIHAHKSILEK